MSTQRPDYDLLVELHKLTEATGDRLAYELYEMAQPIGDRADQQSNSPKPNEKGRPCSLR